MPIRKDSRSREPLVRAKVIRLGSKGWSAAIPLQIYKKESESMHVETGHLIDVPKDLTAKQMKKLLEQGYEPVPEELQPAAVKKLAGKPEAVVSLTSGGKLSKWAGKVRKEKRKTIKESRKRNRGA